jgi:hypothetical protein
LDSTQPHFLHRRYAALASAALLTLASGGFVPKARADGDPASDVLATQALFVPQDAHLPLTRLAQLGAVVDAARRGGYETRVAVIASRSDLGSVTALWGRPQSYAQFLGQELALVYRGPLLVVMPAGLGLYGSGAQRSAITGIQAVPLGSAAITAVQRVAAASGHALAVPAVSSAGPQKSDITAWIVFALGAAIVLLAWIASLRGRPPRLWNHRRKYP